MENRPKYQNNQNNLIKVNSLIGNSVSNIIKITNLNL